MYPSAHIGTGRDCCSDDEKIKVKLRLFISYTRYDRIRAALRVFHIVPQTAF